MFRVSVDFREGALLLAMFKFQGDEKAPCRKQATFFYIPLESLSDA